MILRSNSRSCRTASIRSGRAGGLARELGRAVRRKMPVSRAEIELLSRRLEQEEAANRYLQARVKTLVRTAGDQPLFREAVARMRLYLERHAMPSRPIILTGYPKCGNTLTRLVYHNLIAVAKRGATETMTYTRLNKVSPNHSFPGNMTLKGFIEPADFDHSGFPLMLHSHNCWEPFWDDIGDLLFIERHPLDSLIGHWYTLVRFPVVPQEHIGVDAFVLRELPDWIDRYLTNKPRAKACLRYEDVVSHPLRVFEGVFRVLGVSFVAKDLQRAVAMTTFEKVRAMEEAHDEHHGHVADPVRCKVVGSQTWRKAPGIRFARSGKIGQWPDELEPATIDRAVAMLSEAGLAQFTVRPVRQAAARPELSHEVRDKIGPWEAK
jgi:Sulfotransferase domain